jgi:hypothetical protein
MRRISLALALIGAVVATGCGGGDRPNSTAAKKGTFGASYTVTVNNIGPGTVADTVAGNTCVAAVPPATINTCVFTYPWDTGATFTATATGSSYFNGWFGECGGMNPCTLAGNADAYVVAYFSAAPESHPNFTSGLLHAAAVSNCTPGTNKAPLICSRCHGANLQGVGIAPACTSCHATDGTPIHDAAAVSGFLANPCQTQP